jgi:hypothetical protein
MSSRGRTRDECFLVRPKTHAALVQATRNSEGFLTDRLGMMINTTDDPRKGKTNPRQLRLHQSPDSVYCGQPSRTRVIQRSSKGIAATQFPTHSARCHTHFVTFHASDHIPTTSSRVSRRNAQTHAQQQRNVDNDHTSNIPGSQA